MTKVEQLDFDVWDYVRYFFHLIWLSRVPAFSAILGGVIFYTVPQARDLVIEVQNKDFHLDVGIYVTFVYLAIFFGWMLPVYFSATWAIQKSTHPLSNESTLIWMRRLVPLLLVLTALGGMLGGCYRAWTDVRVIWSNEVEWGQMPNIVLHIQGVMLAIVIFFGINGVPQRLLDKPVAHWLFLLGLVLAAALVWTVWIKPWEIQNEYVQNVDTVADGGPTRAYFIANYLPLGVAIAYLGYYAGRRRWFAESTRQKIFEKAAYVYVSAIFTLAFLFIPPKYITDWSETWLPVHRLMLAPLLLGAWVPALTYIGYLSFKVRAPLILILLGGALLAGNLSTMHHLRSTPAMERPEQLALSEAVQLWRKHNNCKTGRDCPPLVLVAMQGGASRAAFFSATVVGELLDRTAMRQGMDKQPTGNQVFAISGVSGGSLGAAIIAAAIRDSSYERQDASPPCRAFSNGQPDISLWHRATPNGNKRNPDEKTYHQTWRNCLQAIASGDFLSSTMARLAFADLFGVTNVLGLSDRARVLADSWERKYEDIVGRKSLGDPFSYFLPNDDRWSPLLLLNGTSVETGRRVIASHLAPSYCTSGTTKRLFPGAYDIAELHGAEYSLECPSQDPFAPAPSFSHDHGMSLSEAVLVSARFPVISPPGRVSTPGKVEDAILDGGYFDTSGLATLRDLAVAIRDIDRTQKVVNLLITNDPNMTETTCVPPESEQRPFPSTSYSTELPLPAVLRSVLNARTGRSEHAGATACMELRANGQDFFHIGVYRPEGPKKPANTEEDVTPCGPNPKPGRSVIPEEIVEEQKSAEKEQAARDFEGISMSWWLSKQVQRYLDNQVRVNGVRYKLKRKRYDDTAAPKRNECQIRKLISRVIVRPAITSECASALNIKAASAEATARLCR